MTQTQQLEEVLTRLTAEQMARLLSFAESLAAETAPNRVAGKFSAESRRRLRELTAKSEAETLTEIERLEYVALAEQRENADAARLETAAEFSRRRNISPSAALAELDAENTNGNG